MTQKDGVDGCISIHLLHFYIFTPPLVKTGMHGGMQNTASHMTPKMTAMKDSILNQSKNFAQNNQVGQMSSNMRGQAYNTVQQGKKWLGHQTHQV
ncbi:hypothetical protein ACRS38_09850 [Staphylococcus epidermidis]